MPALPASIRGIRRRPAQRRGSSPFSENSSRPAPGSESFAPGSAPSVPGSAPFARRSESSAPGSAPSRGTLDLHAMVGAIRLAVRKSPLEVCVSPTEVRTARPKVGATRTRSRGSPRGARHSRPWWERRRPEGEPSRPRSRNLRPRCGRLRSGPAGADTGAARSAPWRKSPLIRIPNRGAAFRCTGWPAPGSLTTDIPGETLRASSPAFLFFVSEGARELWRGYVVCCPVV